MFDTARLADELDQMRARLRQLSAAARELKLPSGPATPHEELWRSGTARLYRYPAPDGSEEIGRAHV